MNNLISSTAISLCCQERENFTFPSLFSISSPPVLSCEFPPPSLDDEAFHLTNHAGSYISFSGLVFCLVNEFNQLTTKSSRWWECLREREKQQQQAVRVKHIIS